LVVQPQGVGFTSAIAFDNRLLSTSLHVAKRHHGNNRRAGWMTVEA
jgi:hypothetical protein